MIVLGYDTETTGLDTSKERIIEVGVILYDTEKKQPLRMYDTLVRPSGEPLPDGYISPTGIHGEWLINHGVSFPQAMGEIQRMIAAMPEPIVIAHNGLNFDKPITLAELARNQIIDHGLVGAHWIDPRQDLPFKIEPSSRRLTHLAADHGFVNPFEHRAIFDVLTMLKLMDHYSYEETLALSKMPVVTLRALVTFKMEAERKSAKELRYSWDGVKQLWTKQVRENAVARETAAAAEKGFSVVTI